MLYKNVILFNLKFLGAVCRLKFRKFLNFSLQTAPQILLLRHNKINKVYCIIYIIFILLFETFFWDCPLLLPLDKPTQLTKLVYNRWLAADVTPLLHHTIVNKLLH